MSARSFATHPAPRLYALTGIYSCRHINGVTTALFEILAEPNRRRVLDLLREQERTVGELVDAIDMSQPAVSKHLRVLRDAGLVEARIDAQRRLYSLTPSRLPMSTRGSRRIGSSGAAGSPRCNATWRSDR